MDESQTIELNKEKCKNFIATENDNSQIIQRIIENGQFDRVHKPNLTYDYFFRNYLVPNVPVIITGISDEWECRNWVHIEPNSSICDINFEYLKEKIGSNAKVPVSNCHKEYFNSHETLELHFHEYIDYWRDRVTRRINGTLLNSTENTEKLFYLKDWHLRHQIPAYKFYQTPSYFGSDWLNEYCEEKNTDDYRFVYMGPKGTWTPFHVDVFSSFSWSTNIVGTKKWLFLLPGEEIKLKDKQNFGNFPFSIDESLLIEKCVKYIEIIQNAGETVFVPSGWWHQVWNLAETISVNHNWFNSCNVLTIWTEMYEKYLYVVDEIDDCNDMDDFDGQCQLVLKSEFGMNFDIFLDLLDVIVDNRIRVLSSGNAAELVNDVWLGRRHALHDLKAVADVLDDLETKRHEHIKRCEEKSTNIFEKLCSVDEVIC